MLHLDVSGSKCLPFRTPPKGKRFATFGGQCSQCGIRVETGLEKHQSDGQTSLVCPFCHACMHLDAAAMAQAGKVIWLPEITQEQLNLSCVAIFMALVHAPRPSSHEDASLPQPSDQTLNQLKVLYKSLEYRSAPVEGLFGECPTELFDPTSLAFFAQQIFIAKRKNVDLSRYSGFKFLPNPSVFLKTIRSWSSTYKDFPIEEWAGIVIEKNEMEPIDG